MRASPLPLAPAKVSLYHRSAAEAVGEDMLLELVDWAYRKLAYLNSDAHKHAAATMRGEPNGRGRPTATRLG